MLEPNVVYIGTFEVHKLENNVVVQERFVFFDEDEAKAYIKTYVEAYKPTVACMVNGWVMPAKLVTPIGKAN
jgi:hypothetical protein